MYIVINLAHQAWSTQLTQTPNQVKFITGYKLMVTFIIVKIEKKIYHFSASKRPKKESSQVYN